MLNISKFILNKKKELSKTYFKCLKPKFVTNCLLFFMGRKLQKLTVVRKGFFNLKYCVKNIENLKIGNSFKSWHSTFSNIFAGRQLFFNIKKNVNILYLYVSDIRDSIGVSFYFSSLIVDFCHKKHAQHWALNDKYLLTDHTLSNIITITLIIWWMINK